MSSSLAHFLGKGVWIHNAVAEVWLHALIKRISELEERDPWLKSLREDIFAALEARWIDGVLVSSFAELRGEQFETFKSIARDVRDELLDIAVSHSVVIKGEFSASADFLVPEVIRLVELFESHDSFLERPCIYIKDYGWKMA